MFEKWEIVSTPLNSIHYCRKADKIRFLFNGKYTTFVNVFCIVRQLNYKIYKSKPNLKKRSVVCNWYCSIIGRKKGDKSSEYITIVESKEFDEEFLAIVWAEKYIKEKLQCNIEAPLLLPNIGTIDFNKPIPKT